MKFELANKIWSFQILQNSYTFMWLKVSFRSLGCWNPYSLIVLAAVIARVFWLKVFRVEVLVCWSLRFIVRNFAFVYRFNNDVELFFKKSLADLYCFQNLDGCFESSKALVLMHVTKIRIYHCSELQNIWSGLFAYQKITGFLNGKFA